MTDIQENRTGSIEAKAASSASLSTAEPVAFHAVADEELKHFRRFQRPIPLAVSAVFAGIFFGTLYPAYDTVHFALTGFGEFGLHQLLFFTVAAVSFGVSVTAGIVAARGRTEVSRALDAIHNRTQILLPPGHPAGPPTA